MIKRFQNLPPLTSLRGFEAAARLGSFSRAADELNLTQSAVSHQIRTLEEHFEQPLFHRVGRSIQLTDAGTDFHETVLHVLQTLDRGSQRLAIYANERSVVLFAPQSLSARWLTPRLSSLKEEHPGIEPWIATFHDMPNLESAETHLAIVTGEDNCEGWVSDLLFEDAVLPLCHAGLLSDPEAPAVAEAIENNPLLHDEASIGWTDWLSFSGFEAGDVQSGTYFSEPALALDAALHKQGIVLGSVVLAARDVEVGLLIPLSPMVMETKTVYRLYCREESLNTTAVSNMREWILQEATATREALKALNLYPGSL